MQSHKSSCDRSICNTTGGKKALCTQMSTGKAREVDDTQLTSPVGQVLSVPAGMLGMGVVYHLVIPQCLVSQVQPVPQALSP